LPRRKHPRPTITGDYISSTMIMPDWFIQAASRTKTREEKLRLQRWQAIQLLKRALRFIDGQVTSGLVRYEYDFGDENPWIKIQIMLKPPEEPVRVSEEPPG
jgi:hypothetical protein